MEQGEIIERLRRDHLDDAVEPFLWAGETLTGNINDAIRQVCLRARCLTDAETPAVTQYALTEGARYITLHKSILAVRHARIAGHSIGLKGITAKRLWKCEPTWESSNPGHPHFWIPDYHDGRLYFDRPVDRAGVLYLNVWRMPLDAERLEPGDDGAEPAIPEHWHEYLIDWAAHLAFSAKDTEMGDERRAAEYERRFTEKVGRLPSATEIRLWGISPIAGIQPEFV